MDENSNNEFENIIASVYTITNDPFFSSLGFKPQRFSKVLHKKTEEEEDSNMIVLARGFHNIPMDAALHCVIVTLLVFIVVNLLCKLLLYILV